MFRKLLTLIAVAFGSIALGQVPISGLPPANLPLQPLDVVAVNQTVGGAKSTRSATVGNFTTLAPPIAATYLLQSGNALIPNSRTLTGSANQVILTDGGALGPLTLSLPQPIGTANTPTFGGMTLTGGLGGTSATFSGALASAGYSGTTGVFSGAVSALSLTLTNPLLVPSGGTGIVSYAVGDLLSASTTTALSKIPDVAAGSYLRSGGVATLPLWSTLTLPNAATQGDLLVATGSNAIGNLTAVAAGSYLRANGAGAAPIYSTTTIPNTSVLGDLWYGSASNIVTALPGNITTTRQFLSQTGSGAVSAAPAWGTIAAGDLPGGFSGFANPSGLVTLTAANGVATTATRSDATHALDQSIAPTWSGTHKFTGVLPFSVASTYTSLGLDGGLPAIVLTNSAVAANQRLWEVFTNSTDFIVQAINDGVTVGSAALRVTRGAGTQALSTIALGNSTDNPNVNVASNGLTQTGSGAAGTSAQNLITNTSTTEADFHVSTPVGDVCVSSNNRATAANCGTPAGLVGVQSTTALYLGGTAVNVPSAAIRSVAGGTSAANTVATTMFTFPNATMTNWLVSCNITGSGDVTNYGASSIVTTGGATAKITALQTATLMSISLSGLALQCTQGSGGPNTITWSVLRWGT